MAAGSVIFVGYILNMWHGFAFALSIRMGLRDEMAPIGFAFGYGYDGNTKDAWDT